MVQIREKGEAQQVNVILSGGFLTAYEIVLAEFETTTGIKVTTGVGKSQGNEPDVIGAQLRRGVPADAVILAYVGPIPADVQFISVFSGAIVTGSAKVEAARMLLAFLASDKVAASIKKAGMELPTENATTDRRGFLGAVGVAIGLAVVGRLRVAEAAVAPRARNVVLVHGLYADGSSWANVIGPLQDAGLNVTSVQNPLTTLADGVAATRRALAMQQGPTVLAGHSWSGTIVSEVGDDPKVSALVFVAARAPDAGEDFPALTKQFPSPPVSAGIVTTDGFVQLSEAAFLNDFANGVAPATARVLYAAQTPAAATLPSEKTSVAAWRSKPSWYAVSTQDRTINPDLERFLAKRMNATTIEVAAGHLSLVSHPKEIAALILAAAGVVP